MATDPKMLMCTGRYKDLARNGFGGSVASPCANNYGLQIYCNQPDVDSWNAVAWDLYRRVRAAWNDTNRDVVIPTEIVDYITTLENDFCEQDSDGQCVKYLLPESSWYNVNWNAQAAATISKWCARAACALELLDNARNIQGPVEEVQENSEIASDLAKGVGGAIGGIGGAIGDVGKGVGGALGGAGSAISLLPIAIVTGMGMLLAGGILYLRHIGAQARRPSTNPNRPALNPASDTTDTI